MSTTEPQPCPDGWSKAEHCPWAEEDHPPKWWRDEVDSAPWEAVTQDGTVLWYSKTSRCPRCGYDDAVKKDVPAEGVQTVDVPADTVLVEDVTGRTGTRLEDTDVFVVCKCAEPHGGRPDDLKRGCGYGGYVSGPP